MSKLVKEHCSESDAEGTCVSYEYFAVASADILP